MKRVRVAVGILFALVCVSVHAADLGATYPSGSITTREQAQRAMLDAQAAQSEADAEHRKEVKRCASVFQVNKCTDDAQRKFDAQKREIRRIELEARDVRRRLDAEERAAKRAKSESRYDGADAPKALPDADARAVEQAEKDKAAAESREKFQERQKAHAKELEEHKQKEAAEAPERDANVKAFAEKQREAAEYAKRKEDERLANEKRREERRQERERQQKELENQAKQ